MRCIEIAVKIVLENKHDMININMRCIEMHTICICEMTYIGLTLTWDVLKYLCNSSIIYKNPRLTLTWDVLKCLHQL